MFVSPARMVMRSTGMEFSDRPEGRASTIIGTVFPNHSAGTATSISPISRLQSGRPFVKV